MAKFVLESMELKRIPKKVDSDELLIMQIERNEEQLIVTLKFISDGNTSAIKDEDLLYKLHKLLDEGL